MQAAAISFETITRVGEPSFNLTGATIAEVYAPLKTTVVLLVDGKQTLCLIAPNFVAHTRRLYRDIQAIVSQTLNIPRQSVLVFNSHNHTAPALTTEPPKVLWGDGPRTGKTPLTPSGKRFLDGLRRSIKPLPSLLTDVAVSYAHARERRISYNRKGHRADGTTYMLREEDRVKLGRDYTGDIDDNVSLVRLDNGDGQPVVVFAHFNAHPATAYHPERPVVHPEYCGIACDLLQNTLPSNCHVAFLQGCAGEMNSKGLLTGDAKRADKHGRQLGKTLIKAARRWTPSATNGLKLDRSIAAVPLSRLPSLRTVLKEREVIESFAQKAKAGDEDTLSCLGLNFPRALTPPYRAALVAPLREWNNWAQRQHRTGKVDQLPTTLDMEVCTLRLGDVAMVGIPGEPMSPIGQQIRRDSCAPFTIPCGYCNISQGYIPDSGNFQDNDYMSAFFRYTTHTRYRHPAGDALAHHATRVIRQLFS